MEDLGNALNGDNEMIMMGGGNPAYIPEIEIALQKRLKTLSDSTDNVRKLVGIYDPPQGNMEFIRNIVDLLNKEHGLQLTERNVALTNGSQAAFFKLFNLFAGEYPDGRFKKILLPLTPEYIGYSDAGLSTSLFQSFRSKIELIGEYHFKYHIDFDALDGADDIGAVCVSRPTNPSGNVISDHELSRLIEFAKQRNVPLILDGAYGMPFPSLIFSDAKLAWDENVVFCLSLSKFGMPAARTGIVIGSEEIVQAVASTNAILNLATGGFGAILANDLVAQGEILRLSHEVIRPYYLEKAQKAEAQLLSRLRGLPCKLHSIEGAMFMWLWCRDCPVNSQELYERLKERGVLVVPGHYFFPGLSDQDKRAWPHVNECLRITYSQDDKDVSRGIDVIAQVLHDAYSTAA